MGDFNAIRWENEKFGGSKSNNTSMQNFNDCIDHCGLLELNLANPLFTWSNSSVGKSRIECKLDRH